MMGVDGGWGLLIDAGVLGLTKSRTRHLDGSSAFSSQREWELIVIDIIDLSEIEKTIAEAKSLMFNDAERDLRYYIKEYPTFTVLDVALSQREWFIADEPNGAVKKHLSTTLDQIVFCAILIALLRDHLIDLGDHILQSSEKKEVQS